MTEDNLVAVADANTGEFYQRSMTPEELERDAVDRAAAAVAEAERVAAEEARAAAKASAIAKLEALGLTADEASALLGV
jgi:hypothetical protein